VIAYRLVTISIGTASSMPHTFQTQPQNSRPTKIATAFIRARAAASHGVSRKSFEAGDPSETPETSPHADVPNCRNAMTAVRGDDHGSEIRNRVEEAAYSPRSAACSTPSARKAIQVTTATIRAREQLHHQERLDLRSISSGSPASFLLGSEGPAIFTACGGTGRLTAGGRTEKQDQHQLAERPRRSERSHIT
jgi:hypothetical protein